MSLSERSKKILDIAMGSKLRADALVAKLEANEELSYREKKELEIAMCDKKAAAEIALDELAIGADDQAAVDAAQAALDAYVAPVAAEATLDLTADIVLTSVAVGAARNGNTFTLQVLAAAANASDEVEVAFSGTSSAIVCTVTPNDGTNNSATPVDLSTAELVELINTGDVAGKNINLTDGSSLRALQTASGGDSTALADAGEGDGVVGTFAGGVTEVGNLAMLEADLAAAKAQQSEDQISDSTKRAMIAALADKDAADDLEALIEE